MNYKIYLLKRGKLEIIRNDNVIYEIDGNSKMAFVGEIKLLNKTDGRSTATVRASEDC